MSYKNRTGSVVVFLKIISANTKTKKTPPQTIIFLKKNFIRISINNVFIYFL